MSEAKKDGDFTKREREIREALFAVFYKSEWTLTFKPPRSDEGHEEQWKFVDAVIDELRSQKL